MQAGEKQRRERDRELIRRAGAVLRKNDQGSWTKAAPELYPHQWSWDSGLIAAGLAHLDPVRAAEELRTLFASQWRNGKVPHIVFNPEAPPESYFPGAEHWTSAGVFPEAPSAPPYTSALCQPPVHATGALRVWEISQARGIEEEVETVRRFLEEVYPKLVLWHRYLLTERDPEGTGLVTIYHPWESGTDNSPRWDAALRHVEVGKMAGFRRQDLVHVDDPAERPTDEDYNRYLWLVEVVKAYRCDERLLQRSHPFRVKDVLASAILVRANRDLERISAVVGAPESDRDELRGWAALGRRGLEGCWDEEYGLCLDRDEVTGEPLRARTVAGFAPLVSGGLDEGRKARLLKTLDSRYFLGDERLARKLPPSTSPAERRFHPRSYWRGPVWPVVSWLLWRSLRELGELARAASLREESLAQVEAGGFAEYFEPFTGEPLGSEEQSWTAAVVLDWLAHPEGTGEA